MIYQPRAKSLGTHPYEIGRFMLITINGTCLLLLFIFTARLIERLGTTDWGRIFVMAGCVFGTFLTTFSVTITNHLPAAACTAVLLGRLVRIWLDGDRRAWTFIVAGFFSGCWRPTRFPPARSPPWRAFSCSAFRPEDTAYLPAARPASDRGLFRHELDRRQSLKPAQMHRSENDNWYDYPSSYWNNRQGIDAGEKSTGVYARTCSSATTAFSRSRRSGCFSCSAPASGSSAAKASPAGSGGRSLFAERDPIWRQALFPRGAEFAPLAGILGLLITLVCFAFYIWFDGVDRNYGGNASAFRWVFWLAPLWLVLMLPAADLMSRRTWSRAVGLLLLAASALSCHYPTWNPSSTRGS